MKINWKVRFKNKEWLITFVSVVISFVYQILGLCGIVTPIGEDTLVQTIALIINALAFAGVLIDPTTKGASDSDRALTYVEPN